MVEKNFFGKWKFQQLDEKGHPVLMQTMNTRRRRNVSYHTRGRKLSLAHQAPPIKYTSEIVRKSDNYTLKIGDCIFYQEANRSLEAWFIYNILYKELDRSIDVMVIRLVDWEFLEQKYDFKYSDHGFDGDKYNELIVFSEFDVIMADSWYQTINVSSYKDYEEKKNKSENGESHKYVRYLFDLANKCLREINYGLFKEQCTSENALENFKRLISSGHGKALLDPKRQAPTFPVTHDLPNSVPLQANGKCPRPKPLNNRHNGEKDQKDLAWNKESAEFSNTTLPRPNNGFINEKGNNNEDNFIFEKVNSKQIKQENSNYPLSLGATISLDGLSTIKDLSSNDEVPTRDTSLELVRNGKNKSNESLSENTDSSTPGSFIASIKNKKLKIRHTENSDSELPSNGLSMYKTFPVHFDDFNKHLLSLKASYLSPKKRQKGKIVVNPDNIEDITVLHPVSLSEYEIKKQTQKTKSSSVPQEKHKGFLESKKENTSLVEVVDYMDTSYSVHLKPPNIAYLNTPLELKKKEEAMKGSNIENYLQKTHVDNICKKISDEVLFRKAETERVLMKLTEFLNDSSSSSYIISGSEGTGKLYFINKVVEEFLKFINLPQSCVRMKYEAAVFEKGEIVQCFIDQLLERMDYRKDNLEHRNGQKLHKLVVIIDHLELFLNQNSAFVSSLLTWAEEMKFEMLFICDFNINEKSLCINSDIQFSNYSFNQLSEIMMFALERESKNYIFYTEKYSGAVVFFLNEISRLDIEKDKSKYIMHKAAFSNDTLKYLVSLASKPQFTIGKVLETALKALTLLQEVYYNEHPAHNAFKSFESTMKQYGDVNNNQTISIKDFNVSVDDIQTAEGLLNNWANEKLAQSLKTSSKLTLWVLTKMQREGSTNNVSTFAFFQFFEKSLIENADNPLLKEVMSIVTLKGSIGTNIFNWDYVFEELTNLGLIHSSKSEDGKIISLSLINKPAVEKMISSFTKSLQ